MKFRAEAAVVFLFLVVGSGVAQLTWIAGNVPVGNSPDFWEATRSSTTAGGAANLAIDNDFATVLASCAQSDNTPGGTNWIAIDTLNGNKIISAVVAKATSDGGGGIGAPATPAKIYIGDTRPTDVATAQSNPLCKGDAISTDGTPAGNLAGQSITFTCTAPKQGQYVIFTRGPRLVLCEVTLTYVCAAGSGEVNCDDCSVGSYSTGGSQAACTPCAAAKTTAAVASTLDTDCVYFLNSTTAPNWGGGSSESNPPGPAVNAVDGNAATCALLTGGLGVDQWITIDTLTQGKTISAINVKSTVSGQSLRFFIRNTIPTSVSAIVSTGFCVDGDYTSTTNAEQTFACGTPRRGRYIVIYKPASTPLNLCEVTANFVCAAGYGGSNCAFCPVGSYSTGGSTAPCDACPVAKTTISPITTRASDCEYFLYSTTAPNWGGGSNENNPPGPAVNAVDGKPNTCAEVSATAFNWIVIDTLTEGKKISAVRVNSTKASQPLSIYIGNQLPTTVDEVTINSLCKSQTYGTAGQVQTFNCLAARTGRYIIFLDTSGVGLRLCDVTLDPTEYVCLPGYGGANCAPCPADQYSPGGNLDDCQVCLAGTTTDSATTQASCDVCAAGYFGYGPGQCSQCDVGTYNPSTGAPECQDCPTGTTTSGLGASDVSQCGLCLPGYAPTCSAPQTWTLTVVDIVDPDIVHVDNGWELLVTTATQGTLTFSNPSPLVITPLGGAGSTSSNIIVSGLVGVISDLQVNLINLNTTWMGDMELYLTAPSGPKVQLISEPCGSEDINGGTFRIKDSFLTRFGDACTNPYPAGDYATQSGQALSDLVAALPAPTPGGPGCCPFCNVGEYSTSGLICESCPTGTTTPTTTSSLRSQCSLCEPGYFGYGPDNCEQCLKGTYSNTIGAPKCKDCTAGTTTSGLGANDISQCDVCTKGYFDDGGSCEKCPVRTYKDVEGPAACTPCATGVTTATDGSTSESQCSLCVPGYFGYGPNNCAQCEVGTYSDTVGAPVCQDCPTGYTTSGLGSNDASQCDLCVPGFAPGCGSPPQTWTLTVEDILSPDIVHVDNGWQLLVTTATQGTLTFSNPTPMLITPLGGPGSTTSNISVSGLVGVVSDLQVNLINLNTTWMSDMELYLTAPSGPKVELISQTCSGQDINGGTFRIKDSFLTRFGNACTNPYPAGDYATESGRALSDLVAALPVYGSCCACDVGEYSTAGLTCEPCPTGTTTPNMTSTSVSQCNLCRPGYAGCDGECTPCAEGTYANTTDSPNECKPCPLGTTTVFNTSVAIADCSICAKGYEKIGGVCVQCARGTYGDVVNGTCKACPVGTTTAQNTSTSISQCDICIPGFAGAGGVCPECGPGAYSTVEGSETCTPCPEGFTTVGNTSTTIDNCNICATGYYAVNTLCVQCPRGSYTNVTDAGACTPCPIGFISYFPGATSVADCGYCALGYSRQGGRGEQCFICPVGQYSDVLNGLNCKTCPLGTTTGSQGSTSRTQCVRV